MKKFLVVICSVVLAFGLAGCIAKARLRSARARRRWFKQKGRNNRSPVRFWKGRRKAVFCFGTSFRACPLLAQSRHLDAVDLCSLLGIKRTSVVSAVLVRTPICLILFWWHSSPKEHDLGHSR